LHKVADAGRFGPGEVPQVVDVDTLSANAFQGIGAQP
jgi:hypothetical protein